MRKQRPGDRRHPTSAGFTFLELVVVLTLMAVISAMVIPVFGPSFRSVQVRSAQDEILALIGQTQEMAVRQGREYHFCIDPKERIFWVRFVADMDGMEKITEDVSDRWGRVQDFPGYLDLRQPRMRKDSETGAFYIACYPNGACDRVKLEFFDNRFRGQKFRIETQGALGQTIAERD
ncbi:MAG: prepilin-type N-terminal cleavage/methylation domain-containing protein [Candidatus Hydrogenedens sp.]|nr:prepilin-type N-terminal cleavage/methylation domain-containing protein [Candidatus Hydrogenedens sp.]